MKLPKTLLWNGKTYKVPSLKTLANWSAWYYTKTPDGRKTELDDPNGWLKLLKIW